MHVSVDTTVQEKNITFPTDSKKKLIIKFMLTQVNFHKKKL